MNLDQLSDAEIIRHEYSAKTPFMAKDVDQQMSIAVRGYAVDFVVGRHNTMNLAFFHRSLKRFQPILPDDSFRIITRRNVGSGFGLAMNREMFGRRENEGFVHERSETLESLDGRDSDARNEIWIFAICFFRAPQIG